MRRSLARVLVAAALSLAAGRSEAAPPYLIFHKPQAGAVVKWTSEIDLQVTAQISEFKYDYNTTGDHQVKASCPALGSTATNVSLHPWGGAGNPWHEKFPIPLITTQLVVTCTATVYGGSPMKSWSTQGSFTIQAPGPADLAVTPEPDSASVWPQNFKVVNVGNSVSEATLLRVKVDVLDGDVDLVKRSCWPKMTDFDEVVPALTPAGTASSSATIKPPPPHLINLRYVPRAASALGGSGDGISTQPRTPVKSDKPDGRGSGLSVLVNCRFSVTAELSPNHNLNDPNKANNKLTRVLAMQMPPK